MRGEKDHSKLELKDTLQVSQKKPNTETISLNDPVNKRSHLPINNGFDYVAALKILTLIWWAGTCKS